jgi:hypothetical protein
VLSIFHVEKKLPRTNAIAPKQRQREMSEVFGPLGASSNAVTKELAGRPNPFCRTTANELIVGRIVPLSESQR